MDGNKRRQAIIDILKNSLQPVSGTYLAKTLQVSRQVIVQDIALLRAGDYDIYSTHKGYVLNTQKVCKRIFKVHHDDNDILMLHFLVSLNVPFVDLSYNF